MSEDRDDVAQLLERIACEQEVIDQLAAGTQRLRAIQQAKCALSTLDAALRRAVAKRHAALESSA